mgnify:CR=1 FL=1
MKTTRRDFLLSVGAVGAVSSLNYFGALNALAQTATNDYKALVCIFLYGGNDGNNTIIPVDGRYADYAKVRTLRWLIWHRCIPLAKWQCCLMSALCCNPSTLSAISMQQAIQSSPPTSFPTQISNNNGKRVSSLSIRARVGVDASLTGSAC